MSVTLGSIAGIQKAFSSGVDSIATGLAKATQAGGLSEVKNTLEAFRSEGIKPFDSAGIQGFKEIAGPGFLPPPGEFFSKLALTQSPAGNFQPLDFANKLADTSLDPMTQLDGLKSSVEGSLDTMGDLGSLDSLKMQSMMERRSKFLEALSNMLKLMHDTASSITQNLK